MYRGSAKVARGFPGARFPKVQCRHRDSPPPKSLAFRCTPRQRQHGPVGTFEETRNNDYRLSRITSRPAHVGGFRGYRPRSAVGIIKIGLPKGGSGNAQLFSGSVNRGGCPFGWRQPIERCRGMGSIVFPAPTRRILETSARVDAIFTATNRISLCDDFGGRIDTILTSVLVPPRAGPCNIAIFVVQASPSCLSHAIATLAQRTTPLCRTGPRLGASQSL